MRLFIQPHPLMAYGWACKIPHADIPAPKRNEKALKKMIG